MQQRAALTQRALIHAAAEDFDRHGYEGASLSRISKGANSSMGALTFHFPTKRALADAVRATGRGIVEPVVWEALSDTGTPLRVLAELTAALVRLLNDDVVVRAAARLERDGPDTTADSAQARVWSLALRTLLERAGAAGELRPGVQPETAASLIASLVEGSRERAGRKLGEPRTGTASSADFWDLVLHGVSAARS
ncbi:TetR family transcriptional regulator [Streptomyces tendae]|uniref:TetR family transcriptional regulator n=1 Tax=Streptomyces tendae TaxID=1932 RepID=UPI0037103616